VSGTDTRAPAPWSGIPPAGFSLFPIRSLGGPSVQEDADSSTLPLPRVFVRVFPEMGALKQAVRFYESLTELRLDIDMEIPDAGLHVVGVGSFLILEMDPDKLGRIEQAKQTRITVLAPYPKPAVASSLRHGAVVLQDRWESPPAPGTAYVTRRTARGVSRTPTQHRRRRQPERTAPLVDWSNRGRSAPVATGQPSSAG
jgi:hypothetical protein